jgi:alanyl-tRNA synthetase
VSESSGCLDLSDSTSKFSVSRTHFDINKFGKPTEEDFETVRDVVKKMIGSSYRVVLARSQSNYAPSWVSR